MRRRVGRIFLKLLQLVALALSSIATAAVILEGGFWVRHALHAHIDNGSESGSRRIFLVGDSVLGNIREPDSIAGHFASAIRSRQNAPSSIVDLSEPAQTLYAANQKIADDFKIDESTVIIVMLGKSDWERPSAVTQRVSWLDRLQILKIWGLVKADTSRAIQYWQQKFSPSDPESSPDFAVAWMLYGKGNCHDAIPMFEKGLLQRANYLRAIQSLYHCYYLEKRFKEGKLFLEQLSPLSTKLSQLIKLYALNLQNEFETQTSSISTQSQAATSQLLISMPVSRETFRIPMRL
ncbi:MAG: hypothetical protein JNJ49_00225, partial [Bdellovibrionaceae bacterium]|nr:hypothetical protein [Pseudobdellovibrionaceae bacterium]